MFQYTLQNEQGFNYTLYTTAFLEPGSQVTHLGQRCQVQDLDVYNGISCDEIAASNSNYRGYGFY